MDDNNNPMLMAIDGCFLGNCEYIHASYMVKKLLNELDINITGQLFINFGYSVEEFNCDPPAYNEH